MKKNQEKRRQGALARLIQSNSGSPDTWPFGRRMEYIALKRLNMTWRDTQELQVQHELNKRL